MSVFPLQRRLGRGPRRNIFALKSSSILGSTPVYPSSIANPSISQSTSTHVNTPERATSEEEFHAPQEKADVQPVWQTTSLTTFTDFYNEMRVSQSRMLLVNTLQLNSFLMQSLTRSWKDGFSRETNRKQRLEIINRRNYRL